MEYLFKFLLLIVVIPIILITLSFTIKHTQTPIVGMYHNFTGNSRETSIFIERLCDSCMSSGYNKDCFIIHLSLTNGSITNKTFTYLNYRKNYKTIINKNITKGDFDIKISSNNNNCYLKVFE